VLMWMMLLVLLMWVLCWDEGSRMLCNHSTPCSALLHAFSSVSYIQHEQLRSADLAGKL
jgi:hypothetical protein